MTAQVTTHSAQSAAPAARDLTARTAARLRRPTWRDPRLAVGILLVATSVALGAWAVSAAQASTPVWAARDTITPGQPVTSENLVVAEVRLPPGEHRLYLDARAPLPTEVVAVRTVPAGELVPASAIGPADRLDLHPVPVTGVVPTDAVVVGAQVDLWFVPGARHGADEPYALATGLTVAQVEAGSGAFAQGQSVVHVLVPSAQLPAVLAASADDGDLRVVPLLGGS